MSWLNGMLGDLYILASEMSAPVMLGGFLLQGHEVPNRITVGGAQALAVHKLPGGGRIIDAMGADDGSIAWRAVFVGPDAAQRARVLDVMRKMGAPVTLSFGDYAFTIIIAHYEYGYAARGAVIDYSIKGEIISRQDQAQLAQSSLIPMSL